MLHVQSLSYASLLCTEQWVVCVIRWYAQHLTFAFSWKDYLSAISISETSSFSFGIVSSISSINLVWFSLHDKKYVNSEGILDLEDLTIIFVDVTTLWSFCVCDWTFEITVSNQIYTIATFRYIGKKLPGKQGFFAIEVKFWKLHLLVVSWTKISLWYNRFSTTSFRYTFPVSGDDGSLCQFQHQMDWYIILSRYEFIQSQNLWRTTRPV